MANSSKRGGGGREEDNVSTINPSSHSTNNNSNTVAPQSLRFSTRKGTRGRRMPFAAERRPARDFHCDICFRAFRRKDHLLRHYECLHRDARRNACDVCGFATNRMNNLRAHTAQRHGGVAQAQEPVSPPVADNIYLPAMAMSSPDLLGDMLRHTGPSPVTRRSARLLARSSSSASIKLAGN